MKTWLTLLLLITTSIFSIAQEFEVPVYEFKTAEDYAPYNPKVLECINWLMKTPINEQSSKRKDANAFMLAYLSGSPDIHIEIKPEIVTFIGSKTPDLLMAFMGGWAKYSIESEDYKNKVTGSLKGIETVIQFYEANKKVIPKDKDVEKYIKMKEKGTLKDYIEKNA